MKIGIGLSLNENACEAAEDAVGQARRAVKNPDLVLAFGSIHLDQQEVYSGLMKAGLDPSLLFGGSSYAEISPAGVTYGSVVVLLVELPGARIKTINVPFKEDPAILSQDLLQKLGTWPPNQESMDLGLMLSCISPGRENEVLASLKQHLPGLAIFGGMTCGNYDLGMSHPEFWANYQYCDSAVQNRVQMATLQLAAGEYISSFGLGHGWETLGPAHLVTRAEGATVYELDGMPIVDFYRQFLGRDADERFFELLVQRYGLALQMDPGSSPITKVKTPVQIDRQSGSMNFYPAEDLQGRQVSLIQANRKSLIAGARRAAQQCLEGLEGRKPHLILAVSCSQRGAILHSRSNAEIEAVREVMGEEVPIMGWYSGGEIVPFLNRHRDVIDPESTLGGTGFHGTTLGLLAISSSQPPGRPVVPDRVDRKSSGRDMESLLQQCEETLDSTESFLSNLSRQVYNDGQRIRAQSEVLHRYTPHEVWSQAGASAERGEYEIADAEFNGAFLFMDVQGFTSYSEKHSPNEVVRSLNALFEPATAIIYEYGGDVDKYMGDCIFAAFHDGIKAVQAGSRILSLFREVRARGNPFNVRIGINSGRAIRANVGGRDRREYTFIGDAVNLAQRLESHCTPGKMLISEELFLLNSLPGAPLMGAVERRILTVKGKKEPLVAYECAARGS